MAANGISETLKHFSFARYRFILEAIEPLVLPVQKGSMLRGTLGQGLRKVCCDKISANCAGCADQFRCAYAYLFETPPEIGGEKFGHMQHSDMPKAPHPYVLRPPGEKRRRYETGERMAFEIVLIGRAVRFFPQVAAAVAEAGLSGIGSRSAGNGRFRLEKVESTPPFGETTFGEMIKAEYAAGSHTPVPESMNRCQVHLMTPLQIKERYTWLRFGTLFANLRRRLCALAALHCDLNYRELAENGSLMDAADRVETKRSDLWKVQWHRYSNRQKQKHSMKGLLGLMEFKGDFSDLWPLLRLGEVTHAGRKTTFGFGRYEVSFE